MADTFQSSSNPQSSDRRIYGRQKVSYSRIELGENNLGVVLDISQNGLALMAEAELIDDQLPKMRFYFSLAHTWIEANGRIVWRSASKKVAGIEFIGLSDEARKQIQNSFTSGASEFPRTNVPLEWNEQVSWAMATSEPTGAIPFPAPKLAELVPEDRSPDSIFPSVQSPVKTQNAGTVSESAMAANFTRGHLVGLSLAVVLLLVAFLPVRQHLQKAGKSQKGRETITEQNLPGPSSKISATPPSNPAPTPDHPAPTFNPVRALDHPAFVLQVGAMVREENANALALSLNQMNFPAFVLKRPTDRFHRVFVGPYNGAEAALGAKNELEKRGFKSFRNEWKPQPQ